MRKSACLVGSVALVLGSLMAGRLGAVPAPAPDEGGVAAGPDVIVGAVTGISKWGAVGSIAAYSIGTTSCNIGNVILLWCDTNVAGLCNNTQHPVIAQNFFRIKNGRMEQIGMSWLKHGFCALSQTLCGPCTSDPWGCDALGIGCSDPYDSGLNGSQSNLGPRSQVNAATGVFPYPFTAPPAPATIGRRLQVLNSDLDPAMNPGALYFAEGHYVTADDAAAGNDNNNASYRQFTVGTFTSGAWNLAFVGSTTQQKSALQAWKDHGLGIGNPDPNVVIQNVDVAGDGRFEVAYKVSQIDANTWHYEYAVHNLCSDRSGQSWTVPVPAGVVVTNQGQTMINHHSGEPYSTAAWTMSAPAGSRKWESQTFAQNANANALRWSTMYNFRFDANRPPVPVTATLGLFKSGTAANPTVTVLGPSAPPCPADLTGDGTVDGADLGLLIAQWGGPGTADLDGSGTVDGADLGMLIAGWGPC